MYQYFDSDITLYWYLLSRVVLWLPLVTCDMLLLYTYVQRDVTDLQ